MNTELFSFHNEQNIIFSMNMKDLACIFFYMGVFSAFMNISSMWFKAWETEGTENCCFELWNFDTESILDLA